MLNPHFSKSVIAVALSSLFAGTAIAETAKEDEVERIAVWSTQVKTSSLYLQGEEIADKQADHISDLLRTIPGVDVGGAHSLNQRITIRSMDDKDLNIAIDGAAQNSYMYHHMGNLQIHADILKSVEIEVGTNSVINGGLGGAVRFETKDANDLLAEDEKFGTRIQVSAGDNSGSNYSLTVFGLLGDSVDFLGYYNAVDRDNYEVGEGKIIGADGKEVPGTDGEVKGLEGELDDALIKFGWNIDNSQRLAISYESYKDEGDYSFRPDMGLATDLAITNSLNAPLLWPTEFTRDTFTLNYDLQWGESQLKAAVFTNTSELWRDESGWAQNPAYAPWAAIVTGEAKNSGANLLAESAIDGLWSSSIDHNLTYGFDHVKHETDYHSKAESGVTTSAEEVTTTAVFIQDRIDFNNGLAVIPGVRFEDYDIDSAVIDDSFDDTLFALAAEYQITQNLLVKISTTEVFKGPEIGEVFTGAGIRDRENSEIKAETGTNNEFAFAYQDSVLGADNFTLGATFFNTEIDGYIYDYAEVPNGGPRDYWKDNIGDMEIDGFEAYVGYQIGQFSSQITFSSAESELHAFSGYEQYENARLDRQQGDTFSANFSYFFETINLDVNWEVMDVDDVEAALDIDGPSLDNSKNGFTVHNISARWQPELLAGLTLIVGVDNLFDEFYASQSSRTGTSFHPRFGELYLVDYEPGRNIKATLAYQF